MVAIHKPQLSGRISSSVPQKQLEIYKEPAKDIGTKETFKKELVHFLSKNGLGKIISRETGKEFVFTGSQFHAWYKNYQKDKGQSFLKELKASNLTESFNYFAKNDLTIALAILFEQEKKMEASGDVFVFRFDQCHGRWVSIADSLKDLTFSDDS